MIPHTDTTLIPNKRIRMDIYDIDGIIRYALQSGVDISPADRQEWRLFCCALKVLGYDESTFVRLSSGAEKDSRKAWREERNPRRYKTEDGAKGMIVELAKSAGVEVRHFLLSRNQEPKPSRYPDRLRTSATSRTALARPTQAEPTTAPDYLPMDAVRAAQSHAEETALFAWMAQEFGEQAARFIFGVYMVGASKHTAPNGYRAAAFPYISTAQKVVDCKLFHIDPTTGSRKTAAPLRSWTDREGKQQELRSSWALAEMNADRRRRNLPELNRAKWCNFGDHLLPERPTAEVCLVESEKTALIAALTYPDRVWIAVGSKNNLTPERCATYMGREVVLFPDRDNYNDKPRKDGHGIEKGWRTLARELTAAGLRLRLDTTTERHEGKPNDDIADLILRYRHGEQRTPPPPPPVQEPTDPNRAEAERIFERMKETSPALKELAERLELTAVSVEPYNPELHNTK